LNGRIIGLKWEQEKTGEWINVFQFEVVEEKDHFNKFKRWLQTERGGKWARTKYSKKFINYIDVLKDKIKEEVLKQEEEEAMKALQEE